MAPLNGELFYYLTTIYIIRGEILCPDVEEWQQREPQQKPKQPKGRAKLAKAANAKGQMSLGFAAAVQPGGKAELVAINQRPKDAGGGAEAGSGQASAAESMQQLLVRITPLKNGGDHSFGSRFGPLRNRPPVF